MCGRVAPLAATAQGSSVMPALPKARLPARQQHRSTAMASVGLTAGGADIKVGNVLAQHGLEIPARKKGAEAAR